jgi:hypothetical protein
MLVSVVLMAGYCLLPLVLNAFLLKCISFGFALFRNVLVVVSKQWFPMELVFSAVVLFFVLLLSLVLLVS